MTYFTELLFVSAGGSSSGSTKSATIEMYVGSSYNETISGETLSSISEKSGSYISNEHEALHRGHDFSVSVTTIIYYYY